MSRSDPNRHEQLGTLYTRIPRIACKKLHLRGFTWVLIANFLVFGFPFWLIFLFGFWSSFDFSKGGMLLAVSLGIGSIWIYLGPMLICFWENRYCSFVMTLATRPRFDKPDDFKFEKIVGRYSNIAVYAGLVTASLSVFLFCIAYDYLRTVIRFDERPLVLYATVIVVLVSGYTGGYGFSGVWQSLILFRKMHSLRLAWMPFDPDGKGGFEFLGNFALQTSISFACGIVVVPATFLVAEQASSASIWLIWSALGLYSLGIFASFAYPMFESYRIAAHQRRLELQRIGSEASKLFARIKVAQDWSGDNASRELDMLAKIYSLEQGVKSASPLPFSLDAIIGIIPAVASPLLSTSVLAWLVAHIPGLSTIIEQFK